MLISFYKKIRYKLLSYLPKGSLFLWSYAAYLTWRYVDKWEQFPAIKFNSFVRIKFHKKKDSTLIIKTRLIFESFLGCNNPTIFTLGSKATITIENDFTFGGGIKVLVCPNAELLLGGKVKETGSGITADSHIMVRKYLKIGYDCLIAWNTFITDYDWHTVGNKNPQANTTIGDHVWIGVGVKILKGANISQNSIVTTNSVVLQGDYPSQAMITGIPGKVVKENIENWVR